MELISLLSTAKQAGVDVSAIIGLIAIYLMLKKFVNAQNKELKVVVNEQVDKIVKAIGAHNERLDNIEEDVKALKKKLG